MSTQTIEPQNMPAPGTYSTRPANLTPEERIAYDKGFSRGARAYIKANGSPAVQLTEHSPATGTAARAMLARQVAGTMEPYLAARHPVAHKAGMTAVRSWVRKYATSDEAAAVRLAEIIDPLAAVKAPAARKVRAVKPATVKAPAKREARAVKPAPVETPAPLEPAAVPEPMPAQTWAARKASRRELAAAMRAAGLTPSGQTWELAKAGTPIADLAGLVTA